MPTGQQQCSNDLKDMHSSQALGSRVQLLLTAAVKLFSPHGLVSGCCPLELDLCSRCQLWWVFGAILTLFGGEVPLVDLRELPRQRTSAHY